MDRIVLIFFKDLFPPVRKDHSMAGMISRMICAASSYRKSSTKAAASRSLSRCVIRNGYPERRFKRTRSECQRRRSWFSTTVC